MPTLTALCQELGGDLYPADGVEPTPREVTAVHVSELLDPAPYLSGGELLLTTGMVLTGQADEARGYVARLRERDIAALGFGLGVVHASVPHTLLDSCASLGLPLMLVPPPTPFLVVARRFWSLLVEESQQELRAALASHRDLVRAAAGPHPVSAVVRSLAGAVGGWAAQLSADGQVMETWPRSRRWNAAQVASEIGRLRLAGPRSSAVFPLAGEEVVLHPVCTGGRATGFLAAARPGGMKAADRQLVLAAVSLLALEGEQRRRGVIARRVTRSCVARLVMSGFVPAARSLAADCGLPPVPSRLRVLGLGGLQRASFDDVLDMVEASLPSPSQPVGVFQGSCAWVLLPSEDATAALGAVTPLVSEHAGHARALLSAELGVAELHQHLSGLNHALEALLPGQVRDCTPTDAPQALVDLGTLLAYRRSDLVPAVVAYLRHRGQWERAAADLGVHRNTLRHRIGTAIRVLGQDLDDPDVASRVWLELRARGLA